MTEWLGLRDKVVVITGAAGGMGTKFSHDFAEQGAKLVLMDIAEERVEKLSKELADYNMAQLEERGKFEGRPVTFQMTVDDIFAVGKGTLIGRPEKK